MYLDAKKGEGRSPGHLENMTRAVHAFVNQVGDIPIDAFPRSIIDAALAFRASFENRARKIPGIPTGHLFVNMNSRGWTRATLLHAAQRAWKRAGLKQKKIHEIRRTLGTIAGKNFTPGIVQAMMGHRSRKSSETYFHPDAAGMGRVWRKKRRCPPRLSVFFAAPSAAIRFITTASSTCTVRKRGVNCRMGMSGVF